MSYYPYVGDRVTDLNLEDEGTVLYVHGRQAVVAFDGEEDAGLYKFNEIVKVKPRPKVREQSIGIKGDGYISGRTPTNARIVAKTYYCHVTDKDISVAVVCDLDGEPLEVMR